MNLLKFCRLAWLAMLFAAGMGMGLVFWGVAEPLFHYQMPPQLILGVLLLLMRRCALVSFTGGYIRG
tara:strand:- start:626 stop:826 length:201 start_codon:yes stop_codon:yes gene_type:complete